MNNSSEVRTLGNLEMSEITSHLLTGNMPWFFVEYPEGFDPENSEEFSATFGWNRATELSIEFDPDGHRRYPKVTYPTILVSSFWYSRRIVDPATLQWDDASVRKEHAAQIRAKAENMLARAEEIEQGGMR